MMDTCRRYGYKYPCAGDGGDSDKAGGANHEVCRLDPVAFRGAPCSDAAGQQMCFKDVMRLLQESGSPVHWDATQQSPFFGFLDSSAPGKSPPDIFFPKRWGLEDTPILARG